MNFKLYIAAAATSVLLATGASAATLKLEGFTSSLKTVNVATSPVTASPYNAGASGFNMTDLTDGMGSFIAWCVDLGHTLMSVGGTQDYDLTDTPYSNSFALTDGAIARIQSLFDANYGALDTSDSAQATAFQMAIWESAYESDGNAANVADGVFQASNASANSLANAFLANAAGYAGAKLYNLTFLEVAGLGADRPANSGQNLVTVTPVPLPAAGLLLLTALGGMGLMGRRRRSVATV